jgi:uncharacterized membrane protein
MKATFLRFVLPVLFVAVVVHVALVWAVPRLVMYKVMQGAARLGGANMVYHAEPATGAVRTIPLPSPDLLYSICELDVSAGPVEISVTPGPDYLSLAVFDAATDNVFVTNDQQAGGKPIHLLVAHAGAVMPAVPAGVTLVRMNTPRGLLLLRALAATPALKARNDAARHTLTCKHTNQ